MLVSYSDFSDRRNRRSSHRPRAMHFQLSYAAREFGFRSLALADSDGNLLASSQAPLEYSNLGRLLATFGPSLDRQRVGLNLSRAAKVSLELRLMSSAETLGRDEATMRLFHVNGEKLYLVAVGEPTTMSEVGMYRVIMGIRRIWSETMEGGPQEAIA